MCTRQSAVDALVVALACAGAVACAPERTAAPQPDTPRAPSAAGRAPEATVSVEKPVSFSVLEDYDKGDDLAEVAADFELMRELGIDTWRGSFGWDDYEPAPGEYDFEWLHRFASLAERYGIKLRPYIGYTAPWAARGGEDDQYWNDPPADLGAWRDFVYALASAMRRHPNLRSYEIYNEVDARVWWDGTRADYRAVLDAAAAAIREADPDAQVVAAGLVHPNVEWIRGLCAVPGAARSAGGGGPRKAGGGDSAGAGGGAPRGSSALGAGRSFDIVAFHAYPETWTPDGVVVENYLGGRYRDGFVPTVERRCGGQPIWINEAGFATSPGRTEREQADWWARAVATWLAEPSVEHIGVYEIKDLPEDAARIGAPENHYLGLTRSDRTKKLAFHTIDLLTDLLSADALTVADGEVSVEVVGGEVGELHHHLFRRPDGRQVLLIWDKAASPAVDVRLERGGSAAVEYALDGAAAPFPAFDGASLRDVRLAPGQVRIFEIRP